VETIEMERWQNGKMERTAAKKIYCLILKLQKPKFLASRLKRPVMTSSLKKLLTDCFKTSSGRPEDWTVSGQCHLYQRHTYALLRIRRDINAASICSCELLWRSNECALLPFFNTEPKFCSHELLCRSIEFIFLQYANLESW